MLVHYYHIILVWSYTSAAVIINALESSIFICLRKMKTFCVRIDRLKFNFRCREKHFNPFYEYNLSTKKITIIIQSNCNLKVRL